MAQPIARPEGHPCANGWWIYANLCRTCGQIYECERRAIDPEDPRAHSIPRYVMMPIEAATHFETQCPFCTHFEDCDRCRETRTPEECEDFLCLVAGLALSKVTCGVRTVSNTTLYFVHSDTGRVRRASNTEAENNEDVGEDNEGHGDEHHGGDSDTSDSDYVDDGGDYDSDVGHDNDSDSMTEAEV